MTSLLFFVLALMFGCGLLVMAFCGLFVFQSARLLWTITAAMGAALLGVVFSVSMFYLASIRQPSLVWLLTFLFVVVPYIGTVVLLGKKYKTPPIKSFVGALLGLAPLYLLTVYTTVVTACSYGDCL